MTVERIYRIGIAKDNQEDEIAQYLKDRLSTDDWKESEGGWWFMVPEGIWSMAIEKFDLRTFRGEPLTL